MAGKREVNWDACFDIKMRDVGTQTILQEIVAAEQGGSKMVDCQTHWVGRWEPLEDHQDRVGTRVRLRFNGLPHRLKSRGVPAGEQGTYLGMKSSGDCLVRYDNWTDGSMLDVLEDFEVCVPRFTTASTQTQAEQILQLADSGNFLSMQLDQGGSSTEAESCRTDTAYMKLLVECRAACDGLRWQRNVAAWLPPEMTRIRCLTWVICCGESTKSLSASTGSCRGMVARSIVIPTLRHVDDEWASLVHAAMPLSTLDEGCVCHLLLRHSLSANLHAVCFGRQCSKSR